MRPARQSLHCGLMLIVEHVRKAFPGVAARAVLRDVSLELAPGEYIAIMGESGVGKSTLLNLIAGLDTPDAGRILFEGVDLGSLDDTARTLLRRARMGFVFQAFHLLPHLTVERNVALPLALNGAHDAAARARVAEILTAVGLEDRRRSLPGELSGGEMQRVAVARALVHRPRLVLADEPTGNLDAQTGSRVIDLLLELNEASSATLVLVTHDPDLARRAHRIVRIAAGRIIADDRAA